MNAAGGVNGNITYDSDSINEKKDYMLSLIHIYQIADAVGVSVDEVEAIIKKKEPAMA